MRFAALCIMLLLAFASCHKSGSPSSLCQVYVKYTGEERQIVIEETSGSWENNQVTLSATGFDNEQLKIYLPSVSKTGKVSHLSANNIEFSDGLDFASTKLEDGYINIGSLSENEISGEFKVLLLDDVNGIERRTIEGSFKLANQATAN